MAPGWRMSGFAAFVRIDNLGLTIACNTLKGTSLIMSNETAARIAVGKFDGLQDETLSALIENGILTMVTVSEEKHVFLSTLDARGENALIGPPRVYLMPSYDCNLKCIYCFQHKIRRGLPSLHITEPTVLAAFRYLNAVFQGSPSRGLTLYGGEPLTAENRPAVEFICKQASRNDFRLMAATHAWNLDLYEHLLGPKGISAVHVTVDGPESLHDRRRIGPGGSATFSAIMTNIQIALDRGTRVRMRVNVDATVLESLPEFVDYLATKRLLGNGLFSAYLAPLFATKAQIHSDESAATRSHMNESVLAAKLGENPGLALAFGGHPPIYDRILSLINKRSDPSGPGHCCLGTRTLVFDPGGNLYPCVFLVGEPQYSLGSYLASNVAHFANSSQWLTQGTRRCGVKECKYALYCGGGSPYDSFARFGCSTTPSCDCLEFERTFAGYARAAYWRGLTS
jgi:uncharacterized protein